MAELTSEVIALSFSEAAKSSGMRGIFGIERKVYRGIIQLNQK